VLGSGIENAITIDKREAEIMDLRLDDGSNWDFLGEQWSEDGDGVIHLSN
jgi:hypothetical protein